MLLDRLRQSVAGWVAKALIALLVVIFALWGIGDVFGRSPDPAIVEIGSENIPVSRFQRFFINAFNQLQQRAREQNQQIDVATARELGLDRQVLSLLIRQAILEQSAEAFGLKVSDEKLIENIRKDPVFHGTFGSFDRIFFEQVLNNLNISEDSFITERRKEHLRNQLATIFEAQPPAPKLLINQVYRAQNERRVAEYITLKSSLIKKPKPPSDDALKKFIENNSTLFIKEEQRSFSILLLEPKDFLPSIKIPLQRVKEEYQARLDQFTVPEQRLVQQITFPDKKTAQKARQKINGGIEFSKIAKEQKLSQKDISLGWLTAGAYLSPALEKAVRKLRKGDVSQVVNGPFGPVLLHVESIRPGKKKTFNQVQKELRDRLALDGAIDEMYAVHNLIEDERASGENLKKIAQKFPSRLVHIRSLHAGDEPPKNLPEIKNLIQRVFSSTQGEDLSVARTDQDGYYWLEVTDIISSQLPEFSKIRVQAIKLWQQDQRRKKLSLMAEEIIKRGASGAQLKNLTKAPISKTPPLAQFAKSDVLPPNLMAALFRAPRGAFLKGASNNPDEIIVLRLSQINFVQERSEARQKFQQRIQQEITRLLTDEILQQYLVNAQNQYGLEINNNNLQLAFDTLK